MQSFWQCVHWSTKGGNEAECVITIKEPLLDSETICTWMLVTQVFDLEMVEVVRLKTVQHQNQPKNDGTARKHRISHYFIAYLQLQPNKLSHVTSKLSFKLKHN